jgi:hypothetical protein
MILTRSLSLFTVAVLAAVSTTMNASSTRTIKTAEPLREERERCPRAQFIFMDGPHFQGRRIQK